MPICIYFVAGYAGSNTGRRKHADHRLNSGGGKRGTRVTSCAQAVRMQIRSARNRAVVGPVTSRSSAAGNTGSPNCAKITKNTTTNFRTHNVMSRCAGRLIRRKAAADYSVGAIVRREDYVSKLLFPARLFPVSNVIYTWTKTCNKPERVAPVSRYANQ